MRFTCGRRYDRDDMPPQNLDEWLDILGSRRCSHCGSMHPEDFLTALDGGRRIRLVGNYKAYVGSEYEHQFYFAHFDKGQAMRYKMGTQ